MKKAILFILILISLIGIVNNVDAYICSDIDYNDDGVVNVYDLLKINQCKNNNSLNDCEWADLDSNGIIEETDVDLLRKYYLEECLTDKEINCEEADITMDKVVNSFDLLKISQCVVGTITDCDNADINGDGIIGESDKDWVRKFYLQECENETVEIACFSNADCPSVYGEKYCKTSKELCGTTSSFICENPGTAESKCIASGGGLGCKVCENGCQDGACVQGNISSTSTGTETKLKKGEPITEEVKCVFLGDEEFLKDNIPECYSADSGSSRFSCKATEVHEGQAVCVIENVEGYKGEQITWKSTCGGYAYTKIDGDNDYAEFKCTSGEVEEKEIKNIGFRFSHWECYDGYTESNKDETSCKSSGTWQKYAKESCEGHCYEDKSKCGVNSFSVSNECYLDEVEGSTEEPTQSNTTTDSEIGFIETLICKNSCPLKGKCYPFGYRKSGDYCSDEGGFVNQLKAKKTCDNNFECSSNVCVSGECISEGFIKKIMNWFRRMFGGD